MGSLTTPLQSAPNKPHHVQSPRHAKSASRVVLRFSFNLLLILTLLLATLPSAPPAHAATFFWDGTGTSWNLAASWATSAAATTPDPANPPGFSDTATFNITPLTSPQTINLECPTSPSPAWSSPAPAPSSSKAAAAQTLSRSGPAASTSSPPPATTIAAPITLNTATQTWTNSSASTLTLSGDVALGANNLTLAGTGSFNLTGNISSNPTNPTGTITMQGTGTVRLSGNNTYLTSLNAFSGTLIAGSSNALAQQPASPASSTMAHSTSTASTSPTASSPLKAPAPAATAPHQFLRFRCLLRRYHQSRRRQQLLRRRRRQHHPHRRLQLHQRLLHPHQSGPQHPHSRRRRRRYRHRSHTQAGTLVLAKASGPAVHALGGGGLSINGGTAQLAGSGSDQIYDFATVTQSAGTFDFNGQSETFESLNGAGTLTNNLAGTTSTLTLGSFGGNSTYSGTLANGADGAGAFALIKAGTGTLTLSGNVTFSGNLTVSGGTLTLSGGFVSPTILNHGNLIYNAGQINGRLVNAGTVTLNANLTLGGGLENDSSISLPASRTLILGAGLDNQGLFTLSGGTLVLSGISNLNRGTFNLSASAPFDLLSATLNNQGTLNLNTSSLLGTGATLNNNPGGTLVGPGSLLTSLTNSGGLISIPAGTLNISHDFSNSGAILLSSVTASLSGGVINSSGSIRGIGNIGNPINNSGTIEPLGGTLYLAGTLTNSSSGTLRISAGNQLVFLPGLAANPGIITLAGGTFDNNGHALTNTGQITGFGTLSAAGLTNNGSITLTGGLSIINGPVTNSPGKILNIKFNPAIFTGDILNNGTIKTTSTTVTFTGNYTGNAFISDPSTNIFQANVTILPAGLMSGGTGDQFILSGGTLTNGGTFSNAGLLQSSDPVINAGSFTQSGPQLWSPGTLFTNSGTATFASDSGTSNSSPLSITSTGTLLFQSPQHLDLLTLSAGTATAHAVTLTLNALSLDHTNATYFAQLDLTTSKLILQSPSPSEKLAKLPALIGALHAGSANSTWTGQGLTSSTAANDPTHYALALLDNSDLQLPTFGNQPVDSNSLLVSIAHLGDANNNGIIDIQDQSIITNHWQSQEQTWSSGDLNLDGIVDLQDLTLVTNNWQQSSSLSQLPVTNSQSPPTPTPEPATLLVLATPLLLSCRAPPSRRNARYLVGSLTTPLQAATNKPRHVQSPRHAKGASRVKHAIHSPS